MNVEDSESITAKDDYVKEGPIRFVRLELGNVLLFITLSYCFGV